MFPNLLSPEEREDIIKYCKECYGVELHAWDSFDLFKRKEGIWLTPRGHLEMWQTVASENVLPDGFGLRILSGKGFPYKVTGEFFKVFCKEITKRKITLSEDQALAVVRRKDIVGLETTVGPLGYYLGLFEDKFVGVMLLSKEGWVSQVPKSLTCQLSKSLELRD